MRGIERNLLSLLLALGLVAGGLGVETNVAIAATVPVSISSVHAGFYSNPNNSGQLDLSNLATPVFSQDFPVIDFNPPGAAQVSCSNSTGINENSRPFTDIVPQPDGTCTTDPAQGLGGQFGLTVEQAGLNDLFTFQAIFTTNLTVEAQGQVTFNLYSDDGWMLGAGQRQGGTDQPSYASGSMVNPLSSTPLQNLPVVGSFNVPSAPAQNQVTVSFPAAGTYPIEIDYTECCGGQLALVLGTTFGNPIPPSGQPPVTVRGLAPTFGNYTGGTTVTISGSGFTQGAVVTFGGLTAASSFVSSNEITAITPPVAMNQATEVSVSVGSARSPVDFLYYVPQIGVLVSHDASTNQYAGCTASVVHSQSGEIIATAAHCVATGGTSHGPGQYFTDWAFAPGFTGVSGLCDFSKVPPPATGITASSYFTCGNTPPKRIWTGSGSLAAMTDPGWLVCSNCDHPDHDRDYGFVALQPQQLNGANMGIEPYVGSLPITFSQGRVQSWDGYAEPGGSLLHCNSQTPTTFVDGPLPPSQMRFSDCTTFGEGASGGPWISSGLASVGGVNSQCCNPSVPGTMATYLGSEAETTFRNFDALQLTQQMLNVVTAQQLGPGSSIADKLAALIDVFRGSAALVDSCAFVKALVNEIQAQSGKHLTLSQANQLLADTKQIGLVLGCST